METQMSEANTNEASGWISFSGYRIRMDDVLYYKESSTGGGEVFLRSGGNASFNKNEGEGVIAALDAHFNPRDLRQAPPSATVTSTRRS